MEEKVRRYLIYLCTGMFIMTVVLILAVVFTPEAPKKQTYEWSNKLEKVEQWLKQHK